MDLSGLFPSSFVDAEKLWTVEKEGFGVHAFINALTLLDFPTLQFFFSWKRRQIRGRRALTPGTWERDRTKSREQPLSGLPSRSYNALKSPFLSSPPLLLPPESRLIFSLNQVHLVLTSCKQAYKRWKHFILNFRTLLGIPQVPFVSTSRQIASPFTRIHNQPLGFP